MLFRLLLLYLVFLQISQVFAIDTTSPAMIAFAAKDYATYLATVTTELADAAPHNWGQTVLIDRSASAQMLTGYPAGARAFHVRVGASGRANTGEE